MAASTYPAEFVAEHRLADGRTVAIRPVRSDDAGRMRDFLDALSDDSRYMRFQKTIHVPSDKLVHFLTDIDYDRHVALVCTSGQGDSERIVGEARYIAMPVGASCEFGVMVDDGWRRSGIAGVLMNALIRAARDRGFAEMEGFVLVTNAPMLRFARALGFEVEEMPDERTVVRVVRKLRERA